MFGNNNFKIIYLLLKEFKTHILIILICAIFTALIHMIMPILNQKLIDIGIIKLNFSLVIKISLFIFILNLILKACDYIQFIKCEHMKNLLNYKLFYKALKHLFRLKMSELNCSNYNTILGNVMFDISNISKIVDNYMITSLVQIIYIIGGFIGLYFINWKLTLLLLTIIPIKIIITNKISYLRSLYHDELYKCNETYSFWLCDTLNGIIEIKLWGIINKKLEEFKNLQRNLFKSIFKISNLNIGNQIYENIINELIVNIIIFCIGTKLIIENSLTLGGLIAFNSYSSLVLYPISSLTNIKIEMIAIIQSLESYMKFINGEEEQTKLTSTKFKNINMSSINLKFKHVYFSYDKKKDILKDLDFEIKDGQKVAIVGYNGSGKTSLINLILRFYKPTKGNIYINDIDINDIDIDKYRNIFSVMSQNTYLFNTSIKNNITMYKKDDYSKLEIITTKSTAKAFINILPQKYDTLVGNNGALLSGGEKQKIGISRVLFKQSKILILDEATSNYDHASEILFNDMIKEIDGYNIIFVVSHRADILKEMDKIILLEKGEVVSISSYTEFCNNPLFKKFLNEANSQN